MKGFRRRSGVFLLSWVLILTSMLIVVSGCTCGELAIELVIENQTAQVLNITVNDYPVGEVGPRGQIIRRDVDVDMVNYLIEAKNAQGEVVFSETYTFNPDDKYHLQKVEERVKKAVIPPLPE